MKGSCLLARPVVVMISHAIPCPYFLPLFLTSRLSLSSLSHARREGGVGLKEEAKEEREEKPFTRKQVNLESNEERKGKMRRK